MTISKSKNSEPNLIDAELTYNQKTLANLSQHHKLPRINQASKNQSNLLTPNYSTEQQIAIIDQHSLSLIIAGAGSGKSHTLIGRVAYLESQGVKPEEIAVASFTNVAADNITNRYPTIKSVTLSSLFELFYQHQFGNFHPVISDADTFVTRLRGTGLYQSRRLLKYYHNRQEINQKVNTFATYVSAYEHSKAHNKRKWANQLVTFIVNNLPFVSDVIYITNDITIDVESMILFAFYYCAHHHRSSKCHVIVPDEFKTVKYLLVDEAQDTSRLDYVLLFDITIQQQLNLTLIGDSTQTLYEFRGADANMFDMLAKHNLFHINKLTNNYRSKNEILLMANTLLNQLHINNKLRIKLNNNNYPSVTPISFNKQIHMSNYNIDKQPYYKAANQFEMHIKNDSSFINYLVNNYNRHEQIGILTYNRYNANLVSGWVTQIIEDECHKKPDLLNLITLNYLDDPKLSRGVYNIINKTHEYTNPDPYIFATMFLNDFRIYCEQPSSGITPRQENKMYYALQELMNEFKVHHFNTNTIIERTQYLTNLICNFEDKLSADAYQEKQASQKDLHAHGISNAEIVVSTIHSAKGLEFDHCVIICNEQNKHHSFEPDIRMYGVALTRAKLDEYLINLISSQPQKVNTPINDYQKAPLRSTYFDCETNMKEGEFNGQDLKA